MSTFFMFGKYTAEGLQEISAARTKQVTKAIKAQGGKVQSIHALLGEHDLVFIVDLPSVETAMKLSLELFKMTGISFSTSPAVDVAAFDQLAGE